MMMNWDGFLVFGDEELMLGVGFDLNFLFYFFLTWWRSKLVKMGFLFIGSPPSIS